MVSGTAFIKIIGTGHIFEKSVKLVDREVSEFSPDAIAIELDRKRFQMMDSSGWELEERGKIGDVLSSFVKDRSVPNLVAGMFSVIQAQLGREFGIAPGSDMKAAVLNAKKRGIPLLLIDRDVSITLDRMISSPFSEGLSLFSPDNARIGLDRIEDITEDVVVENLMDSIKSRTPTIYRALVDERNRFMAAQLFSYGKRNPGVRILAVVGAGHKKGIEQYLVELNSGGVIEIENRKRGAKMINVLPFVFGLSVFYVLWTLHGLIGRGRNAR